MAGPGLISGNLDDNDEDQTDVLDETFIPESPTSNEIDVDDQQSKRYKLQLKTMSITKHIMTRLGWMDCEPNAFHDGGVSINHEPVLGICIGSEWKDTIASKRQEVLEGRMQSFQAGRPGGVSSGSASGQLFQGVKVVDKDYLEKKNVSAWNGKAK